MDKQLDGRMEVRTDAETRSYLIALSESLDIKISELVREAIAFLYKNRDVYEWQAQSKPKT